MGHPCNNGSDKLEGKGHRSKVKVVRVKNVILVLFEWTVSVDHNKRFGQKDCTLGERGRSVHAQSFSFVGVACYDTAMEKSLHATHGE